MKWESKTECAEQTDKTTIKLTISYFTNKFRIMIIIGIFIFMFRCTKIVPKTEEQKKSNQQNSIKE